MNVAKTRYKDDCREPIVWTSKDGRKLTIEEMEDTHLVNSIRHLKASGGDIIVHGCCGHEADDMYCDVDDNPVYYALLKEAKRRKINNDFIFRKGLFKYA